MKIDKYIIKLQYNNLIVKAILHYLLSVIQRQTLVLRRPYILEMYNKLFIEFYHQLVSTFVCICLD